MLLSHLWKVFGHLRFPLSSLVVEPLDDVLELLEYCGVQGSACFGRLDSAWPAIANNADFRCDIFLFLLPYLFGRIHKHSFISSFMQMLEFL